MRIFKEEILLEDNVINKIITNWIQFAEILLVSGVSMYLGYFYPSVYTRIFSLLNFIVLYMFMFLKLYKILFWVLNKNVRKYLILLLSMSLMAPIFYFFISDIISGLVLLNINFLENVFNG